MSAFAGATVILSAFAGATVIFVGMFPIHLFAIFTVLAVATAIFGAFFATVGAFFATFGVVSAENAWSRRFSSLLGAIGARTVVVHAVRIAGADAVVEVRIIGAICTVFAAIKFC